MTSRRNKQAQRAILAAARFEPSEFGCSACPARFPYTSAVERQRASSALAWHSVGDHPRSNGEDTEA